MNKYFKKIVITALFAVVITAGLFFVSDTVFAQTTGTPDLGLQPVGDDIGLPSTDIRVVIARIIRTALGLLGIVALVLILYAGFVWMTAGGDEEKISQAKKILLNAVIGLVIILSSYAIASFVINRLVGATGTDTTGTGNNGPVGDNPYFPAGIFYVDSLPQGGVMCIRNVHLAVTFNKPVDVATLNGNVVVQTAQGAEEPGSWQAAGETGAVFVPTRDCGSGPADCFAPSTTYKLHFENPTAVRNANGDMTLNCAIRAGCADVEFTTGNGVDRVAPTITIEPIDGDSLVSGAVVPVTVRYTDDNGVQKVDLSADNYFVGSKTISGCQPSGSVVINWPTAGIGVGQHLLSATGYDWAALSYTTSTRVNILPQHCFDNSLQADLGEIQAGPPACGGECGACADSNCTSNSQCSSGYCDSGSCVERMRINSVSPLSGAPGTIVSIAGSYFGTNPGRVFINNTQMPLATTCGAGAWRPWQIIAEVPNGAASGPIRVETAAANGDPAFTDATNDNFGPFISNFTVNSTTRPGLCSITPANGLPFTEASLVGRRLGNAPGQVTIGGQNVLVPLANWTDTIVRARVPLLNNGAVGVKVTQNNVESNSIRFFVDQGLSDTAPVISSVSPDHGARGSYITITGNNFGNQLGRVWFKENTGGQPGDAIEGSFSFPPGCSNTWSDTQIIVKFPVGSGEPGKSYFVQVRPADATQGWSPIGPTFDLESGEPAPGICSISPVSGPVPFASNAPALKIVGEYFGTNPDVYFWTEGASPTAVTGRLQASSATVTNLTTGQSVSTLPAVGTRSGPVVVQRESDDKISNPANFSVLNCVTNNNTCTTPNTHCCVSGVEAGLCRPNNQLCAGETLSGGYIWRISTKDIPRVPRVVERCNNNTDLGLNLPSPSPSTQWDVTANDAHHNICRSASVLVEFSSAHINDIARSNFVINECQANTVDEARRTCTVAQAVPIEGVGDLVPQPSTESASYVKVNPDQSYNSGKWKDNTWYQVVLKKGISAGAGTSTLPLAADRSCSTDSAYCFVFRSDAQDCRMRRVVITPYSFWTSVLEAPIKQRQSSADEGEDVVYNGHGLSTQRCVVMNTAAFAWSWDTQNDDYADIFSTNNNSAKVSALANTVGVGLVSPNNAVHVTAEASLGAASYTGASPLTVDLNNPEVVDFWPKCLQTCTNAEVGVRFNTTMSNRNLPGSAISGPVKLLKCNDENCLSTTPVLSSVDVVLDSASNYKVLKIANSALDSVELEPNSIYQVVLSASTTNVNSPNLLWSAARLGDPSTYSKPYTKEFSWRFKTKAEKCKISRVDVLPQTFIADDVNSKKIYTAQPYASPDSCAPQGQKLNPWSVSWNWSASDSTSAPNVVASVRTFSTRGSNNFCTKDCLRKGSSLAVGSEPIPVCGNGLVEAGEDCDAPLIGAGCGLNCRRLGNNSTSTCGNGIVEPNLGETCDRGIAGGVGCAANCLRSGSSASTGASAVNASICGNGSIGLGEDCDTGITASSTQSTSATNCAQNCLHQGSKLSSSWCYANAVGRGGFSQSLFDAACKNAISRCGDGVNSPDEDPGCDLGGGRKAAWCTDLCLNNDASHSECAAGSEGCGVNRQHTGSSLLYSNPSLCGDGTAGTGEDDICETNLANTHSGINPWALVTGVGLGVATGNPATQKSNIIASTNQNTTSGNISDSGEFVIPCGYTSDAQCQARMGSDWAVATNGCCYMRPRLVGVFPGATSTARFNICPNTAIEATFDQSIDPSTVQNNVIVAKGTTAASCDAAQDVTDLASAYGSDNQIKLPWYKKVVASISRFFKYLTGQTAEAVRTEIRATKWCADPAIGQAAVEQVGTSSNKIIFNLNKPLDVDADYFIALRDGIRSKQGMSIGNTAATGKPIGWKFITGSNMCEIENVQVNPSQVYFNKVNATSTVLASAYTAGGNRIQPIPGFYAWNYVWQPFSNDYISFQQTTSSINTLVAKNRNGEIDIRASAVITANTYSAQSGLAATGKTRAIVFLCENPWPPKDLYLNGNGPYIIFPYEDKLGNNDQYDLPLDTFNGFAIPSSPSGGYFNFRTYYCADSGAFGTADDLPYLRPAVQVDPSVVSDTPTSSLKRFIFTNAKNNDAIGIAVFSNPQHLTVSEWFENDRALGGQGFTGTMQTVKIDGYDALTDGNNIYVDALNYSDTSNNIFSNIYLFSINANAQLETRKVFEQLISNLRFNTNLTNYGYCGLTIDNPGASTACQTDLDCADNEVCSVQIDKLKRNYMRLRDLSEIQRLLGL